MSYHSDYDAHLDNYGNPGIFDDERDFEEEAHTQHLLDTGDGEGDETRPPVLTQEQVDEAYAWADRFIHEHIRHPDAYEYGEPWWKAQQERKEARDSAEVWREHARLAFSSDSPEKLGDCTAKERSALREHRIAALVRTLSPEVRTASGLTKCQHGLYVCADCDS